LILTGSMRNKLFILSLVPLSSPSPNSQIVCLSVCLLSLDCLSSDCVLCACFETEFCVLDFVIFRSLCVWLDFGDREEGRKEGGELGLLCRWKNSSAAAGVFGDLQIFFLPAFEVSAACYHQKLVASFLDCEDFLPTRSKSKLLRLPSSNEKQEQVF
jgi:hypothetical protein